MRLPSLTQILGDRAALRRWREAEGVADPRDMAALLPAARSLREQADRLARTADRHMSARADAVELPPQADWGWRPELWAVALPPRLWPGVQGGADLAPGIKLFHDCPLAEITLRQVRATDARVSAPFGVAMDVLGFDGSFLSLAMDLPEAGREGLGPGHIVSLRTRITQERREEMFARLNVRHGPNTETVVQEVRPADSPDGQVQVEFDLGLQDINPRKVTHAWLDLIVDKPAMNALTIHDLTLTRRPRADI